MPKKQKSGLYRTKLKIGVGPDGDPIYKYLSARTKADLGLCNVAMDAEKQIKTAPFLPGVE